MTTATAQKTSLWPHQQAAAHFRGAGGAGNRVPQLPGAEADEAADATAGDTAQWRAGDGATTTIRAGGVKRMKVLIACEFSGIVRDAFLRLGHDAFSCDLIPTESDWPEDRHIIGDVRELLGDDWDLMIAHPPCTHLAASGARWFKHKQQEQTDALQFVRQLLYAPGPKKIVVENPVGIISTRICKPRQIIQPWQFGHGETKATCLWISSSLPLLQPTSIVSGREARIHRMPPSPDRGRERSRTYTGIADAMAVQWGGDVTQMELSA